MSAQELSAKKTATKPTARNITRATRMCGRLVSSAYTGACSKPRKAAMQKHRAVPRPAPVRVSGLKACRDRPSVAGVGDGGDVEDDDEGDLDDAAGRRAPAR